MTESTSPGDDEAEAANPAERPTYALRIDPLPPLPRNQIADHASVSRFAGPSTMMRLAAAASPVGLDAAFIGVPLDMGSAKHDGARFGPRQIRSESAFLRHHNRATGAAPFDTLRVADLGDVPITIYSIAKSMAIITGFYEAVLAAGCIPLTIGGDHTIALPILRALARRHGPVALVHIDAHAELEDDSSGQRVTHGTPFRRAVEEGLLACDKVFQIGLRGAGQRDGDYVWPRTQGFTVVPAGDVRGHSLMPLMALVRERIGDAPVCISMDIDGLDPTFASGTATPEDGGLTVPQVLEVIRGCHGLQVVAATLLEVAPPCDPSGNTALLGANLLYEMLCALPGVLFRPE